MQKMKMKHRRKKSGESREQYIFIFSLTPLKHYSKIIPCSPISPRHAVTGSGER